MVSTRKKKSQHNRQLSELKATLNDFVICKNTDAGAIVNETLELQTNNDSNDFDRITVGENSTRENQVIESNIDDKIRQAVYSQCRISGA